MTGNPLVDKIISSFNLVGVGIGLSAFIYTTYIAQKPLPQEAVEFARMREQMFNQATLESVHFKRVTINLLSRTQRLRFLDIEMNILPFNEKGVETIENFKPIIYDTAIELAGKMRPDEINTVAGKILLEDQIKTHMNQLTDRPMIKRIFFTKFVIQ